MRIAIDASSAASPLRSGVGVSLVNVLNALARIDSENQYLVCYRLSRLQHFRSLYCPPAPNFHRRIFQEPFYLPRADVFHGGDARLPARNGVAATAMVHDVFALVCDDFATSAFREKKIRRYRHLVECADRIIAASENTRYDLIRLLGARADKVIVSHHGVSDAFRRSPPEEVKRVTAKYSLPTPYVLSLAAFSKRKNIDRVLAAHALLRKQHRIEARLVLAGSLDYWEQCRPTMSRLDPGGQVVLAGFIEDEDLPALYSGARMFVFPSLYEGFGLPPLEAMACGVPVIASNRSSVPEVVGEAGILVDPENEVEMAEAMAAVDSDAALREKLSAAGVQRAKLFTWENAARRLLDVWKTLAH